MSQENKMKKVEKLANEIRLNLKKRGIEKDSVTLILDKYAPIGSPETQLKDLVRRLENILITDKSCVNKVGKIKTLLGVKQFNGA